jgi:hypothetical protein
LIEGDNGQVYTKKKDHPSGYGLGFPKMAKLEVKKIKWIF